MRGSPAVSDIKFSPPVRDHASASRLKCTGPFEWTVFGVFAILVALLTWRHEMWTDEMQAWLIARDNDSVFSLFHALRYEGHPALWYLLLYVPAHLSANPASMQVINFLISLGVAWVVLSAPKLSRPLRLLIVFSYFFFYQYGVNARSYELSTLLLIGAACCLLGDRKHRKTAIVLLAFSINTHVYAAPIAVVLAFLEFYLAPVKTWADARRQLANREFLVAFAVLAASGVIGLATVWPAPDLGPMFAFRHSFGYDLRVSASMVWLIFFPHLPGPIQILLIPVRTAPYVTTVASAALIALAVLLLKTAKARGFFLACTVLEVVEIAITVGSPEVYHLGFIFLSLVIALLIDANEAPADAHPPVSGKARSALLIALLVPQMLCAADAAMLDWIRPYSDAKEVSTWLIRQHLDQNPLVLEPSDFTTAILGYLKRPSAYYPSCRCFGSYEIRNSRRKMYRMATLADLKIARGDSPLPVVLVSSRKLRPDEVRSLDLREIYSARQDSVDTDIFFVYEQTGAGE